MTALVSLAALAPFVALLGAVINGAFGRQLKEPLPGIIGSAAVGLGFLLSLVAFFVLLLSDTTSVAVPLWSYLEAGSLELELGFVIDHLSVLMMLIITGVGLLIHIYSVGYMHGDASFSRYFMGLNLFVAAMLVLVMGDSFLLIFLGWEGVGVCSFLLIGFWYGEKLNADAARKAFIVNRIGDVGFLLAMFLTFKTFGTLEIAAVNEAAGELAFGSAVLGVIGLLYLLAACGKSAQLPLQVWLPDAMAGPTPVSALIHAATMVTAGVYLIARSAPLFAQTPVTSEIVAWVGALTAIIAAVSALAQTDIKKILAYSTVSQLGYMFVAVGVGAYWAGIFHLFTHAFFKALLFLNAGSVIHALGGEQDIGKMGGLGKKMKITGRTSLIATLAIAGVPFLAGFFSKDAILASSLNTNLIGSGVGLYLMLLFTAVLTAFYMFRWYYRVFAGKSRAEKKVAEKVHESPPVMTRPLVVLAGFSVFAGYLGLPEFAFPNWIAHWLEPVIETSVTFSHPPVAIEWLLVFVSVVAVAIGLGLGYYVYHLNDGKLAKAWGSSPAAKLARHGLGFDALYRTIFVRPGEGTTSGLSILDKDLVDRGVTGSFTTVGLLAQFAGRLQTGFVRSYALLMLAGLVVLIVAVALFGGF